MKVTATIKATIIGLSLLTNLMVSKKLIKINLLKRSNTLRKVAQNYSYFIAITPVCISNSIWLVLANDFSIIWWIKYRPSSSFRSIYVFRRRMSTTAKSFYLSEMCPIIHLFITWLIWRSLVSSLSQVAYELSLRLYPGWAQNSIEFSISRNKGTFKSWSQNGNLVLTLLSFIYFVRPLT